MSLLIISIFYSYHVQKKQEKQNHYNFLLFMYFKHVCATKQQEKQTSYNFQSFIYFKLNENTNLIFNVNLFNYIYIIIYLKI